MKNIKYTLIALISLCWISSCNDDLASLNVNPDIVTKPNMNFMLTHNEILLLEQRYFANFGFAAFVNIFSEYGTNFELGMLTNKNVVEYFFSQHYQGALKNLTAQIVNSTEPELVNYHSMASIMKVYVVQRLTDTYGDLPYFEAGLGYEEVLLEPKYDLQKDIYNDLLLQLETAIAGFDTNMALPGSADIVYNGDLEKWKKFGYSLMMKVAMRLSEVDPVTAETYVTKAYAGGVMNQTDDSFVVKYLPSTDYATTANGNAKGILGYPSRKLSAYFVNQLKATGDPRSPFYAVLPNGDTSIENQKGLPFFTNDANVVLEEYSAPNPESFASYEASYIHMSHAQVEFTIAEAAERGWIDTDAKTHYQIGVKSSMELLNTQFPNINPISANQMDSYLTENPYSPNNFEEALNLISTQYWIDSYFNFAEAYANWRRTDLPNVIDHNNRVPTRLRYPAVEYSTNEANVKEAVERMGEDSFYKRVYWDKN